MVGLALGWGVLVYTAPGATLLHHWTLDDGVGTNAADAVGSAPMRLNSLSATNGWRATGKIGGAYEFNGARYFRTYTENTVADPGSEVAIAGWFKASPVIDNRDYIYEFERIYGMRYNNGSLQVSFDDDTANAPLWGGGLDDEQWHHFVAQNTNGVTSLYIDGEWVASRAESLGSLTAASRFSSIGTRYNINNNLDGWVDELRFYSGGLALAEIQALALVANRPPEVQDDAYAGSIDQMLTIAAPGVLANDTEVDGDPVTVALVYNVAQGVLSLSTNGGFTYIPPNGFFGQTFFRYHALDKDGTSAVANVTLTILDPSTSLTTAEVFKIESDLGVTLSDQQKLDLAALVKPQSQSAWRVDAQNRINAHRKANLTVEVVDRQTNPVAAASVRVLMTNHLFRFGGAVTVMDLTDASGSLGAAGSTAAQWKQIVKAMFNSVGADNALKSKITSQHTYLPVFFGWAASNNLPVRGHLLMWPGVGQLADLDDPNAVSGVDYGDHLSTASLSAFKSYNVLGAVDTFKASARGVVDKAALKAVVDAEIAEWAGRWNVYEWDVINETLSNVLLQEILGYQEMATWFHLAASNRVDPTCRLLINEFQIISARFDDANANYISRRNTYFSRIDQIITNSGPITGIGFQSRFNFGHIDPALAYSRLQDFATRYPNLCLVGTEFEMKDRYSSTGAELFIYDETTRAQMTEELMTVYFSHPQVDALVAWDFMNPPASNAPSATLDEKQYTRSMFYYGDGPGGVIGPIAKLNGLVWHYLHRIRFHTDQSGVTDGAGRYAVNAYKGDYGLTVMYQGTNYPASYRLTTNGTRQIMLSSVTVTASPPVIREVKIDHWPFGDAAGTQLRNATNITGTTTFTNATPALTTDGLGRLVVTQHPTATAPNSGYTLYTGLLTMGPRNQGQYELEVKLDEATLTTGDANGATVGFGFRDTQATVDVFRIRLTKTTSGLAVNTFIDNVYTAISNFTGQYVLPATVKLRSVVDLNTRTAAVYMTVGTEPEIFKMNIPLSALATNQWDRLSFLAVNNATDWGTGDSVVIDYLRVRKVNRDFYQDWVARTDWQAYSQQGADEDPDGDGVANQFEYALGGNPVLSDARAVVPRLVLGSSGPRCEFVLGVDSLDLGYWLEQSGSLGEWNQLPTLVVHGQPGDAVSIPLSEPPAGSYFLRLRVGQ